MVGTARRLTSFSTGSVVILMNLLSFCSIWGSPGMYSLANTKRRTWLFYPPGGRQSMPYWQICSLFILHIVAVSAPMTLFLVHMIQKVLTAVCCCRLCRTSAGHSICSLTALTQDNSLIIPLFFVHFDVNCFLRKNAKKLIF